MATLVIMPKQGQSVESCILTELKVKKGDTVTTGEVLFAYETDKASFEETALVGGQVLELFFEEGDEVPVLTGVLVIGEPGESAAEFAAGGAAATAAGSDDGASQTRTKVDVFEAAPAEAGKPTDASSAAAAAASAVPAAQNIFPPAGGGGAVSPRAKALAEKHAINAGALAGSGPEGRVIERDVRAAMEGSSRVTPLAKAVMAESGLERPLTGSGLAGAVRASDLSSKSAGAAAAGAEGGSHVKPLSNMRKLIARSMHASLQNSAQLTHHLGADARRVLELRKKAKAAGQNITINDFVCYAVVRALEKFPDVNAHFLGIDQGVRYFDGVHLALAVDTERGLMVPAVKNAGAMSIGQLAASLKEVAEACRKGAINPDLLSPEAASFTVSNLGNYGVEMFTPVINLPQVAILGVNTIVPRPKDLGDGVYGFVPYMGLSLTYDHRALDGGEATRFLKQIAVEMENLVIW